MAVSVAEARQLIRIVADDTQLPRYVRREAISLETLVLTSPELVSDRLNRIRERVIPDLGLDPPTIDYARCISMEVFFDHHLRTARRRFFRDSEDYLRYLESTGHPA